MPGTVTSEAFHQAAPERESVFACVFLLYIYNICIYIYVYVCVLFVLFGAFWDEDPRSTCRCRLRSVESLRARRSLIQPMGLAAVSFCCMQPIARCSYATCNYGLLFKLFSRSIPSLSICTGVFQRILSKTPAPRTPVRRHTEHEAVLPQALTFGDLQKAAAEEETDEAEEVPATMF